MRVRITPTDWGTVRTAWSNGGGATSAWVHRGFPFAAALTGLDAGSSSASVFASYSSEDVDTRIAAIRAALDPAKRAEATTALGQWLKERASNIFIAHVNEPYGASRKIKHWPCLSEQVTNIDLITGG